ncbi:FliH/SctL family protein [Magnetovibrio sp.]|uniref:FliH/SctL family protein n=1 Tax=Magnetovibrio sp. TaxID=2024836 RepID=UPI002F932DCD
MTVAGHKKFLFDRDFSPEAALKMQLEAQAKAASEAEPVEIVEETLADVPVTYTEEELAQARAEGFQAGHTEATRDLTSALEQRLTNTMDAINAQVANLFDAFARDKEEHSRDAVAVATVIVRKLFPALNMDKAMAEIEHMIVEAMQRTSGSPTLIIRVTPDMKDAVEAKVTELAALRGRDGTVTVMADAKVAEGDATIEWDGGGMVRDSALMWQEIDEIIERNLGSKRAQGDTGSQSASHTETAQEPAQEVVNDAAVEDNENPATESPGEGSEQDEAGDGTPETPDNSG